MLEYLGEAERWKSARTPLPNTAEFRPLKDILESKDKKKKALLTAATAKLDESDSVYEVSKETPIVPDDLYQTTLSDAGLLEKWEKTFNGSDNGRKLFGLITWQYLFHHGSTWRARSSGTPWLGKRGWRYYLKPELIAVSADAKTVPAARLEPGTTRDMPARASVIAVLPTEAAGLVLNQCVLWRTKKTYGRIIRAPRPDPEDDQSTQQCVRFAPLMGEPTGQREIWIDDGKLRVAHQDNCRDIETAN